MLTSFETATAYINFKDLLLYITLIKMGYELMIFVFSHNTGGR